MPQETIRAAARPIEDYSVFLASLVISGREESLIPIGSGTLISCGSIYGIATAHHVISNRIYQNANQIALVVGKDTRREICLRENLTEIVVGKPTAPNNKPDLALIQLPDAHIGWLKAKKSFWNLDIWRERIAKIEFPREAGLWFVCGAAVNMKGIKVDYTPNREVRIFPGIHAYSGAPDFSEEGEYDYCEIEVDLPGVEDRQKDFGGVSGGGVWRVILIQKKDGAIRIGRALYCGVPFYQTKIDNEGKRKILCHGTSSIYEKLYARLRAE